MPEKMTKPDLNLTNSKKRVEQVVFFQFQVVYQFCMDSMKLIQTVNYLLKKYEGRLNYTKLIKLLYLADRKSLAETGRSITDDTYCCMKYGPVLENIYALITKNSSDKDFQNQWDTFFYKDGFDLICINDKLPDTDLCRYEKRILDQIDAQYHDKAYQQMVDIVHDSKVCPEWKMPNGNKGPLSKFDILKNIGYDDEQIHNILAEDDVYNNDKRVYQLLKTEAV